MTERFTMCYEQNDANGWTMSIVDWQTKQPFDYTTYEVHSNSITDTKDEMEDLCLLLNELAEQNEELKSKVKRYMEIELLKAEDFANCHNCRNDRSVHDGVALDGMCAIKGLINVDGYFDTEYHKLPKRTICPYWELEV